MAEFFCTSFCNQGHRMSDGMPLEHECYVLPPKALELERQGDYEGSLELFAQRGSRTSMGVKCAHEWGPPHKGAT